MTNFIYCLQDFFIAFFATFEKLENVPNYIFIGIGIVLFIFWMIVQDALNKKADQEGTLK